MMKSCLWLFFVLSLVQSVFAAPPPKPKLVRWMDYTEALEKAKDSNKLIFVDLYADWCVPCRIMDANTYSDPTVASLLNTRFISTKLDVDSQDTITCDGKRKTVQRCYFDVWNLSVLPAFVLIAPKGLSILTIKDSFTAEEMKYLLYQILEKEKEWISK
jgi:thiol-disulfide isomerase/thioredoxin